MALSPKSGSFPLNSHVSATFSISINSEKFWNLGISKTHRALTSDHLATSVKAVALCGSPHNTLDKYSEEENEESRCNSLNYVFMFDSPHMQINALKEWRFKDFGHLKTFLSTPQYQGFNEDMRCAYKHTHNHTHRCVYTSTHLRTRRH